MDTSTHVLMGLGLASLAQVDPIVSGNEALTQAVLIGTVIGSNAPDFDILYRLKGNNSYLKNHRSHSHSLPILPIWAILISLLIFPFFSGISYFHLLLWTFLAVIVHVLTDLFNVHGTQVLLPFKKTWVSFDTIPLLDTFITILHLAGLLCLLFLNPGLVFVCIYFIMSIYIGVRFVYQKWIKKQLQDHFRHAINIKLIPKASVLKWGVFIETKEDFLFGTYYLNSFSVEHVSTKNKQYVDLIENSSKHPIVIDFLASTNYAFPFVEKKKNGYFIYWKDLRFRQNKFFPYSSIIYISSDGKRIDSVFSGWLYSLKQLRRVLKNWKKLELERKSKLNY